MEFLQTWPAAKFRLNIYFPKNDWKTAKFFEVIYVLFRVVSATVIFFANKLFDRTITS